MLATIASKDIQVPAVFAMHSCFCFNYCKANFVCANWTGKEELLWIGSVHLELLYYNIGILLLWNGINIAH